MLWAVISWDIQRTSHKLWVGIPWGIQTTSFKLLAVNLLIYREAGHGHNPMHESESESVCERERESVCVCVCVCACVSVCVCVCVCVCAHALVYPIQLWTCAGIHTLQLWTYQQLWTSSVVISPKTYSKQYFMGSGEVWHSYRESSHFDCTAPCSLCVHLLPSATV